MAQTTSKHRLRPVLLRLCRSLLWCDKALLLWGGVLALLVVYSFAAQGTALEAPILALSGLWAPLYGAWCWLCALRLVTLACEAAQVRFTRFELLVLLAILAALLGWYGWNTQVRQQLYSWDSLNYYGMQFHLERQFAERPSSGLSYFIAETFVRGIEYLPTLCYFIEIPFCFTDRSVDSYILATACAVFPLLLLTAAGLVKWLAGKAGQAGSKACFAAAMVFCMGLPLLHAALLEGYPDLLGLVFMGCILLFSWDYDFARWQPLRLALLFVSTVLLVASRRWYMFWVVAYYLCYALRLAVRAAQSRQPKPLLRAAAYGCGAAAALLVLFFRMFQNILAADYLHAYASYLSGGFWGEVSHQASCCGLLVLALLAAGLLYGLWQKPLRPAALMAAASTLGAMALFTRVQNMGNHQSLLLMGGCWMLGILGVLALGALPVQARGPARCTAAALLLLNLGAAALGLGQPSALLSQPSLAPPVRQDAQAVRQLAGRLLQECGETPDGIYMTCFSSRYNPDIFAAVCTADPALCRPGTDAFLAFSSGMGVLGTQDFQAGYFTARYVVTCSPYEGTALSQKMNDGFLAWQAASGSHAERYSVTIPETGVTFTVYERVQPYTGQEVQFYQQLFQPEHEAYPGTFGQVFEQAAAQVLPAAQTA